MDYFEREEQKDRENREKEKFEAISERQMRISKKILLSVLTPIGGIFVVLGIVLMFQQDEFIVFLIMGMFFVLLGIILYFALPNKVNYETYKKRVNKYGKNSYYSIIELDAKVSNLEEDNEELKRSIKDLEYKIRELERKRD